MSSKHCSDMDINTEVSTQLSLIDALLSNLDKTITPCSDKKNEQKEEAQNEMPDSTTNTDKNNVNPFHCGDDVLLPNKDGKYYLGTIVELSTNNDNDSCEVGTGVARCLVKFGDGTHAWAPVSTLKLLSAPPADDGRIMCVVCKRREPTPAAGPATNAIIACDMCGRGYHAKCHSPPVDAWINGASWHCKRCVDQRYKVAAAENRALKRSDMLRLKGSQHRRQHQDLTPPCDTSSSTASIHSDGASLQDPHCYCGEEKDRLAQVKHPMLQCCRCSRWFHQRCVSSLRYPLYAGDMLYIFACGSCNGGAEYLRRLELCWLELAHLALYNLTAHKEPNYFDLDAVIMPYIKDNWHAMQLPEKMWRTPLNERRERILTALTSSRKRFKCGREMKKRATIWGLRLPRHPPPPPAQLAHLEQVKKGEPLSDTVVREYAPRLRFLPLAPFPPPDSDVDDCMQPSSSNTDKSSYKTHDQSMIVPVDGHWLNLMTGKRFHVNNCSNSNSENDSNSTCSYESSKPTETEEQHSPSLPTVSCTATQSDTKADIENEDVTNTTNEATPTYEIPPVPSLVQCSVKLAKISNDDVATPSYQSEADTSMSKSACTININTHNSRIATMNLEVSKLSTKNIIEHSKIMSLQHMNRMPAYNGHFLELDSSGDEASRRGTLDTFIPPLKDFQGINNPFLTQFKYPSKKALVSSKQNGRQNHLNARFSLPLPMQYNTMMAPFVRPKKRKLSEKDIVIGPNGEVKRRKFRRPRKYLQLQLNKSCPLPDDSNNTVPTPAENGMPAPQSGYVNKVKIHGRRLRQRQEKNYYENSRRNNTNNNNSASINSVKSLQLSPHKGSCSTVEVDAEQLSALKTSVQSYFRAGQTFKVLARRGAPDAQPAYLIEWDTTS